MTNRADYNMNEPILAFIYLAVEGVMIVFCLFIIEVTVVRIFHVHPLIHVQVMEMPWQLVLVLQIKI